MSDKIKVKPRLVVLGTGFGGYRLLQSINTNAYAVTVISPRNYFLFTPLLASSAVGTIEFRSIVEPIRLARSGVEFFQASSLSMDAAAKTLLCQGASGGDPFEVHYDILVISVGATTNTFGIPGVREHCLFLKDIPDARAVRSKIIACFERANQPDTTAAEKKELLRFAIVGGGPTGVEFAAELHDLLTEDLQSRFSVLMPLAQIEIYEAGDRILNTFDATLSAYTSKAFSRQRIAVHTGSLVTAVEDSQLLLKDGSIIRAGLIVWSAGLAATPFVQALTFEKYRWQLLTDEYLQVGGLSDVFAIGDCAAVKDVYYPATGQLAQQQGKYLAKSFNRRAAQRSVKPFHYFDRGMLAYIGSGRALMDSPVVKARGFLTWLLWRSIYLTKLVSLRNKISVLFDWIRTFIFGRDFSKF